MAAVISVAHLPLVGDEGAPMRRPVTRGDCASVPRPCPFVSCRFSLLVDVVGQRVEDFTGGEGEDLPSESCALDLADSGELTLEEIGKLLGITREGVRLLESRAMQKVVLRGGATYRAFRPEPRRLRRW